MLEVEGLPLFEKQFRYLQGRRFRADFAFIEARLLVEAEGGVWAARKTGHNSGSGIQADCERANAAAVAGYRVLRFTAKDVRQKKEGVKDVLRKALGLLETGS